MAGDLGVRKGPISDINVTPLIDVVLVLLVVFMVITPLLSSGLHVDLPMATTTVAVNDAGQHMVISVTMEGQWAVDQEVLDDNEPTTLTAAIAASRAENFDRWSNTELCGPGSNCGTILVKADRKLKYGDVRKVLDILAENNYTSVFIAAGKEK
ncbi:MAG: biopolymer transporter ExbD [Myxococcota bacterium]